MRTSTRKSARNGHDRSSDWFKVKNTFTEAASDAGTVFNNSLDEIKHRTSRVHNKVAHYTAKKPFRALGIALLAGAFIGILLKRR